jgi:hypothetical protein
MFPVPNPNMQQALNDASNGIQGVKHNTHRHDLAENPLRRVWRGNKEDTITFAGVPTFENKYDEREWIKVIVLVTCKEPIDSARTYRDIWLPRSATGANLVSVKAQQDISQLETRSFLATTGICFPSDMTCYIIKHLLTRMNPFGVHFSCITVSDSGIVQLTTHCRDLPEIETRSGWP